MTDLNTEYTHSQGATKERMQREGGVVLEKRDINEKTGRVIRVGHRARFPFKLNWYRDRDTITRAQEMAGMMFALLSHQAGRDVKFPVAYVREYVASGSVSSGLDWSDQMIDAKKRIYAAEMILTTDERPVIRRVCGDDEYAGEDKKAIKLMQTGLRSLVTYFGLPVE